MNLGETLRNLILKLTTRLLTKDMVVPEQWRSQTFIFAGAKLTQKARDRLGGPGGMHPRENFEI
jgi:hypothetical protein